LLYSEQLSPRALGQRAQIFLESIPLSDVFENKIREIKNREALEKEAVKRIKEKRAKEKAAVRRELSSTVQQLDKETVSELGDLPMCTRTPRMLVTGKSVTCQSPTFCADNSKYLQPQRSAIS
jgi:hypothetical protein